MSSEIQVPTSVLVPVATLKEHPRNYRNHPDDQIAHIMQSIREHGFYRNVIVAKDNTILAGHGVIKACKKMDIKEVPVVKLDIGPNDPRALKVLAGENEIGNLCETDDRLLSEILKEIKDFGNEDISGLLGTGFDDQMLANLVFVTRPHNEIKDKNEAAHWVGMPEYEEGTYTIKLVVSFKTKEDRQRFIDTFKIKIDTMSETVASTRWPFTEREDLSSVKFEGKK